MFADEDLYQSNGLSAGDENVTTVSPMIMSSFYNAVSDLTLPGFGKTLRFVCLALIFQVVCLSESSAELHEGITELESAAISGNEIVVRDASILPNASGSVSDRSEISSEAVAGVLLLHTDVAESRIPDWNGIWRDTGILLGSQFVAAGIIYALPESFSSWSDQQKKNSFNNYAKNVVDPVIDKDEFYINYALHPYWGATYYIRARERGLDKIPSFIYSAAISAMYEFGVECFFEKPSIQDLIVTPVVGSLMGALLFEPLRDVIKRKAELSWYDHAALVLTDPVGVLSLGFEKIFGVQSTVVVNYSTPQISRRTSGSSVSSKSTQVGLSFQFALN